MNVIPTTRQTRFHESCHAAALCLDGWAPAYVRVDQPSETRAGTCRPDWDSRDPDEQTMRLLLRSVLVAPIAESVLIEPWPIGDGWGDECRGDAETARFLAGWLGLDRVDWVTACYDAGCLYRSRPFRHLALMIADALEHDELVLKDELEQLTETIRRKFDG